MRIKEIYRGNTAPKDTDLMWIRGKEILLFSNGGWVNVNESTIVDDSMVEDSTHAVQSKVIQQHLNGLSERIDDIDTELEGINTILESINGD